VIEFLRKITRLFILDDDGDTEERRTEGGGGDVELAMSE
jgi:hypothetical protein